MIIQMLRSNAIFRYAVIVLMFLLITNIAYLMPWMNTPPGHHYTGAGLEAVGDKFIYYSNVLQGFRGMLLQRNMQTSEPQKPRVFSPVWFGVGMTSRIAGISHIAAYHVWRVILTIIYSILVIYIVRQLFARERDRIITLLVVLFGVGWSWLYAEMHPEIFASGVHWLRDFQSSPVELFVTEMYPLLAFVQSPLFMIAHIILLAFFWYGIASVKTMTLVRGVALGSAGFLLALVHPYDALIAVFVFSSWVVWKMYQSRSVAPCIAAAVSVAGLLMGTAVTLALFSSEPALAGWLSQNTTFSPRIQMYFWSFGAFIPLWLLGSYVLLKRLKSLNDWEALMLIWSWAGWLLIYIPILTNRRLTNAWFIPVAIVSSFGIRHLFERFRSFTARSIVMWLLALTIFGGTLWRTVMYTVYAFTLDQKYEAYLDEAIYNALRYVSQTVTPDQVTISNEPFIGMLVTAYAPVRTFVAHQHQTVQYYSKKQQAEWFFADTTGDTEAARKQMFLNDNAIAYIVLYKPSLISDSWVTAVPYLEKVYTSEPVDVYRVTGGGQ